MTNTIRREILIPQPPEQVWQALADSASLAEWMYPNDFEPHVDVDALVARAADAVEALATDGLAAAQQRFN